MKELRKKIKDLHKPVLVDEVLDYLRVTELAHLKNKAKFIDATLGLGGHTLELIKAGVSVLGIETDPESLEKARIRLSEACPGNYSNVDAPNYKLILGNFRDVFDISEKNDFLEADGILMDLGISSFQLDRFERGFSFQNKSAPLDMRVDRSGQGVTASDLLMVLNKGELARLFESVIENKRQASLLAQSVLDYRSERKIEMIGDFLSIVKRSGYRFRKEVSVLPFLALRIAVNCELSNLKEALPKAVSILRPGGRLAVISFHSGEDAIVKEFFRTQEKLGIGRILTKKPIVPDFSEVCKNSRSRSAKMRVFEKI